MTHLDGPVLIHVCKDRTLTYRTRDQPIFNGVALPVYSVESEEMAEMVIVAVAKCMYESHPQIPGKPWYKFADEHAIRMTNGLLELEDLPRVTAALESAHKFLQGL